MSDMEEPPTKLKRYEMSSQFLEGEVEEDGQEEWLSEEILTDDDYNVNAEQDQSASNIDTSQDGTMASADNSIEHLTDSQEAVDGQNVSTDDQNVSADAQNVSADEQYVSTNVQSVSTIGKSLSTIVQMVSTVGQTVVKDFNASSTPQNTSFGIEVKGRHFVVDGTKLNTTGNVMQDFEEELKNQSQLTQPDFPEDLNAFLIRKKDGKLITGNPKLISVADEDKQSDIEDSPKHSGDEDDGNDTDGLLRLLGDEGGKNKKGDDYDDDETADEEDFNFEGGKMKALTIANNALKKRYPASKAVPEDDDITDASSDEESVKKVIPVQRRVSQRNKVKASTVTVTKPLIQPRHANTSTPVRKYAGKRVEGTKVPLKPVQGLLATDKTPATGSVKTSVAAAIKTPVTTVIKTPVTVATKTPVTVATKTPVTVAIKTPVRTTNKSPVTTANKTPVTKTIKIPVTTAVKTPVTAAVKTPVTAAVRTPVTTAVKPPVTVTKAAVSSGVKVTQVTKGPFSGIGTTKNASQQQKATSAPSIKKTDPVESADEEDSDDDTMPRSRVKSAKQPMMTPEVMDEDMPSDMESETDEESLYDELPSSDDESFNEWFTLDIRAERAGDYIPLLGEKAEELLLEEKNRVAIRLDNLKKSISAIAEASRQQADKLGIATAELSELDTQIKAA